MSGTSKRSWDELMDLRKAEYRMFANSVFNFMSIDQGQDANALNGATKLLYPLYDAGSNPSPTPAQSAICGLPCLELTEIHQSFPLPPLLRFTQGSSFTLEYLGFPRRIVGGPNKGAPAVRDEMDIMGESSGAGALFNYLSLAYNTVAPTAGQAYVGASLGAPAIWSTNGVWWRPDHPLHLVFTRSHGVVGTCVLDAYVNGVPVVFQSHLAGDLGFTAAGLLFNNHVLPDDDTQLRPFCGGHLFMRAWVSPLADTTDAGMVSPYEATRLFQRAQRMISTLMFPIPEYPEFLPT